MARKLSAKALKAQQDALITKIYNQYCKGRVINVMKIPPLFKMAEKMLAEGQPEVAIGAAMLAMTEVNPVS